jgi:hypothetical protein
VELVDRVRDIQLFRGVSVDEIFRLVDGARQIGCERGRSLYPSGLLADSVFILIEGAVTFHEDGADRVVPAPTALAVEAVLADRSLREAIDASERVVGLRIAKADFLATAADSSAFARALFGMFLADTEPSEWRVPEVRDRAGASNLQPLDKVFMLRAHPLFGRATVDQCLEIVALTSEVELAEGAVILDDVSPPAIHFLVTGEVRLEADGRSPVTIDPGHTVGVAEGLGGVSRGWRATTTVASRALYLEPSELFRVFGEHPDLLRSLFGGVIGGREEMGGRPHEVLV